MKPKKDEAGLRKQSGLDVKNPALKQGIDMANSKSMTSSLATVDSSPVPEIQVSSQPTFNFGEHAVRVVLRDGEPWFVASDVAKALEYRDAEVAARHLKAHQKGVHPTGVPGQSLIVLNESGLYRLVLRSRKPSAEAFSDWVTGEVLPAIRKTGVYVGKPFSVNPTDELTQGEQDTLRTLLQTSAENLPKAQRGKFMMQGWAKLKSHFKVSYREIPRTEFSAAVSIVTRHTVDWEVVDEELPPKKYHFPLEMAAPHDRWLDNAWMTPRVLTDPKNRALELELIEQLEKDGHDVTGVKLRIIAMREGMEQVEQLKNDLRRVRERLSPVMEIINVGLAERGKNVLFDGEPNLNDPSDRHLYRDQIPHVQFAKEA